jgi:hypothetical protein
MQPPDEKDGRYSNQQGGQIEFPFALLDLGINVGRGRSVSFFKRREKRHEQPLQRAGMPSRAG